MNRSTLLVVLLAVLVIAGLMVVRAIASRGALSEYQMMKAQWRDRFQRLPTEEAYAEFLRAGDKLSYYDAHLLAHVAGEVLYERFGVAGMRFCTVDFAFGCYHGFSGAAFLHDGLSITQGLRDACPQSSKESFLGCMHGLGHGLLAHLGVSSLVAALDACAPLQKDEPIGGCLGGIFMEYNYHTVLSLDGYDLRPYDEAHAYEPCAHEIPDAYKPACYYELPSWWRAAFEEEGRSPDAQFKAIAKLCDAIEDRAMRSVCFNGTGNVIGPHSAYGVKTMRAWCSLMSDADAERDCLNGALAHLLDREGGKDELSELCAEGIVNNQVLCASQRP